jgi:hypothetical protein
MRIRISRLVPFRVFIIVSARLSLSIAPVPLVILALAIVFPLNPPVVPNTAIIIAIPGCVLILIPLIQHQPLDRYRTCQMPLVVRHRDLVWLIVDIPQLFCPFLLRLDIFRVFT